MNGNKYLADTNILIQINKGLESAIPYLDNQLTVSFITEIELLGSLNIPKTIKLQFKEMLDDCFIIDLDKKIKQQTINLRNNYKLKIPDAVIAATAIVYKLPLLTSDSDFKSIKELELVFVEY